MSVAALRSRLAPLLPPPRAGVAVVPTGIAALDRVLSEGGLPCGRLAEVTGRRGSGRTTLVRQLVTAAVAARRWVAVVDASRTLAPRDWAALGESGRLWVVRPPRHDRGAWCADILARSGAFSMVVLDGAPPLARPVAVRLARLAREHDVALVVAGEAGSVVGSALRMRVRRAGPGHPAPEAAARSPDPRLPGPGPEIRITITVEKGGSHHPVEVRCAIDMARRLCAHPEVPDRRGVATRNRRGERVESPHRRATSGTGRGAGSGQRGAGRPGDGQRGAGDGQREPDPVPHPPAAGATLPRKRRFAEPLVRRDAFLLAPLG